MCKKETQNPACRGRSALTPKEQLKQMKQNRKLQAELNKEKIRQEKLKIDNKNALYIARAKAKADKKLSRISNKASFRAEKARYYDLTKQYREQQHEKHKNNLANIFSIFFFGIVLALVCLVVASPFVAHFLKLKNATVITRKVRGRFGLRLRRGR